MVEHCIVIDWLIIGCVSPSDKLVIHSEDASKFNNIRRNRNKEETTKPDSNFRLPLESMSDCARIMQIILWNAPTYFWNLQSGTLYANIVAFFTKVIVTRRSTLLDGCLLNWGGCLVIMRKPRWSGGCLPFRSTWLLVRFVMLNLYL